MNGNIYAKVEGNVGELLEALGTDDKRFVASELAGYAEDDDLVAELLGRGYSIINRDGAVLDDTNYTELTH